MNDITAWCGQASGGHGCGLVLGGGQDADLWTGRAWRCVDLTSERLGVRAGALGWHRQML